MTTRKAAGAARESGDPRVCDQLAGQIAIIATPTLSEIQAAYIASRFRLAAGRAQLMAHLVYGEARS